MFQDRRTYPRRKESVTVRLVLADGEMQGVTTDIGPTGAFFAGTKNARVDDEIDVLVRPAGVRIAPVRLRAQVVRVVQPGGPFPPGMAVRWLWALSEVGSEPVFHVLRKVLHIVGISPESLASGRRVRFDFLPVGGKFEFRSVVPTERREASLPHDAVIREEVSASSRTRASSAHHAAVSRPTLPMSGSVSGGSAVGTASQRPASARSSAPPAASPGSAPRHAAELPIDADDGRTPPSFESELADGTLVQSDPRLHDVDYGGPVVEGHGVARERGGVWSTYRRDSDVVAPVRRRSDVVMTDDLRPIRRSQALSSATSAPQANVSGYFESSRGGGQAGVFDAVERAPAQTSPSQATAPRSGASDGCGVFEADDVRPALRSNAPPKRPDTGRLAEITAKDEPQLSGGHGGQQGLDGDSPFQERSQIFGRGGGLTTGVGENGGQHSAVHAPAEMDLPVTFEHDGRFVPARMVSAAPLAVEIVTSDVTPALDDKLVINMPVEIEGVWRTIYLQGKLLRMPKTREDGHGFVVALESVQEGAYAGAFSRFLSEIQASTK